ARYRVSVSGLRRANDMQPSTILQAGRVLVIPGRGDDVAAASEGQSSRSPATSVRRVHTVRAGETLSGLAARYGVSQASLRAWNGLRGHTIRVGQKLVYHSVREDVLVASSAEAGEYYRVRSGDNLWAISTRFGHSVDDLKRLNDGLTDALQPGQRIRIR